MDTGINETTKNVFIDLENEVDQIWAEAVIYWQLGEALYLRGAAEEEAKIVQEEHRESSAKEGLIREFLERQVPLDWEKRTLEQRRLFWNAEFARDQVETTKRDRVCALEVWCECFGGDAKYLKRVDAMEINGIIASLQNWRHIKKASRFGYCGVQKGFEKL